MRSKIWKRFSRDSRGTIAVLFGFSASVLFVMIGVAVDAARVYSLNDKVRSTLDSAALAGAKLLDDQLSTDAEVEARSKAFLDSHASRFTNSSTTLSNFRARINRLEGTVVASVEVDYKTAFGGLVNMPSIAFTPEATVTYKTKKIELALVLDVTGSMSSGGKMSDLKRAAEDLIDTLFANNPQVGAVRISIIPYSSAVNIGAAYFTAATNQGAGADTCVVERGTMPGAIVDDAPRPGRWAETSNSGANGQYHCPASQVQPLLDIAKPAEQTTLRNLINSLNPDGWTAGHIGLAWGWYSVSPNWSAFWPANNQPKPQSPDVLKGVLLMTDGMFNTAYFGGNKNGDDPTVVHSSGDQALGLCQNIRDAGVALFTVAFDAPVSAADLLTTCAGGAGNAFTAATSSELRDKFRLVADRLSSLRIAK